MKALLFSHYQRAKSFYLRYERWLMPATLVGGFLLDYFTFANIQISVTFSLLLVYWVVCGFVIAFMHAYDAGKLPRRLQYGRLFAPLVIQFTFGALLSASGIFYWFSSAFSASWPIILVIALLMVANDVFRHYFLKPAVQVGVYYFATFSLLSVVLPYLFNSLSAWLFVVAGAASLIIFGLYIWGLALLSSPVRGQWRILVGSIIIICLGMNALYFFNIIPPIPLSLREAGLYHSLRASGGSYMVEAEPESFWQHFIPGQTVHAAVGETIFCYTAVFAPANLRTIIVHHWHYYDSQQKEWVEKSVAPFGIAGGRKEGYKGYSFLSNLQPGEWRVDVTNLRGQVLGRVAFTVVRAEGEVVLEEFVK